MLYFDVQVFYVLTYGGGLSIIITEIWLEAHITEQKYKLCEVPPGHIFNTVSF